MEPSKNIPQAHTFTIDQLGASCAILLLRLWLGMRSLQAGIEKFAGAKLISVPTIVDGKADTNGTQTTISEKFYAWGNYKGIPPTLGDKLQKEPLLMDWSLKVYDYSLGPIFIALGICVLCGLATRLSLLAMGLVYTSLTFGLILLNQASGVAWLGTHIVLVCLALVLANYNRLELGNPLAKWTGANWLINK
ncbi:MAG: hypothetical protein AAF065_07310 [Verrucomicrobiota bacterium]